MNNESESVSKSLLSRIIQNEKVRRMTYYAAPIVVIVAVIICLIILKGQSSRELYEKKTNSMNVCATYVENVLNRSGNVLTQAAYDIENLKLGDDSDPVDILKYEENRFGSDNVINVYLYRDGKMYTTHTVPDDYDVLTKEWYKAALASNGKYVFTDSDVERGCYTVSMTLSDNKSVLAVDMAFEPVMKESEEFFANVGYYVYIIDSNDNVYYIDGDKITIVKAVDILDNDYRMFSEMSIKAAAGRCEYETDHGKIFLCQKLMNGWYVFTFGQEDKKDTNVFKSVFVLLVVIMFMSVGGMFCNHMYNNTVQKIKERQNQREDHLKRMLSSFRKPLSQILLTSNQGLDGTAKEVNYYDGYNQIKDWSIELSSILEKISDFTHSDNDKKDDGLDSNDKYALNKNTKRIILIVLVVAYVISVSISSVASKRGANTNFSKSAAGQLSDTIQWFNMYNNVLDTMAGLAESEIDIYSDYDRSMKFLNAIVCQYEDIEAIYYAPIENPQNIIMSTGWTPPEGFIVREREWFRSALENPYSVYISAPYVDGQTGEYCITISRAICDTDGAINGVAGIDFTFNKLYRFFTESYTDVSYAFLVDSKGIIINHPNTDYLCANGEYTLIDNIECSELLQKQEIIFKDYDGRYKRACINQIPNSSYYVVFVFDLVMLYGSLVIYLLMVTMIFTFLLIFIGSRMNNLIRWQDENRNKLIQAVQIAQNTSDSKIQFLAQMSHEIRTPINAVLGMNEMIIRESDSPEIKKYAGNIKNAGRTLLTLINSILDFTKIDGGTMDIVPVKYSTKVLIDDLMIMISDKFQQKKLQFITKIDPNIPSVLFGDDVRVRQIIINLLTNAVKYTEKGSVTLYMAGVYSENGFDLRVEVIDTGIGILPEDRDKLFQSFKRLDEVKNRNIEGTGLGIPIVSKLLNLMGSHLEVDSEYGKGSTFAFTLKQDVIDSTPMGQTEIVMNNEVHDNKYVFAPKADILVVDDNEINIEVAKGLLKRNAVNVDSALSGRECLDLLRKKHYDILFLDHMMPGMDGVETLKVIREDNILNESTKIICLTANALVGDKDRYLELGFDDYLSKPIEIPSIENILSTYLPKDKLNFKSDESGTKQADSLSDLNKNDEAAAFHSSDVKDDTEDNTEDNTEEKMLFIEKATGLKYCGNNEDFYKKILAKYAESDFDDKLEKACENNDIKEYQISVHALKSASKSIGAINFSEYARESEEYCKAGNFDEVKKMHGALLKYYRSICENIV